MNAQRELIYKQRRKVLDGENLKENILHMFSSIVEDVVSMHCDIAEGEEINREALAQDIQITFGITDLESLKQEEIVSHDIVEELYQKVVDKYEQKKKTLEKKN